MNKEDEQKKTNKQTNHCTKANKKDIIKEEPQKIKTNTDEKSYQTHKRVIFVIKKKQICEKAKVYNHLHLLMCS